MGQTDAIICGVVPYYLSNPHGCKYLLKDLTGWAYTQLQQKYVHVFENEDAYKNSFYSERTHENLRTT